MKTKAIEYVGPARPGRVFQDASGRWINAKFGEPIETDTETANGLLAQVDEWREPKPGPKPKASQTD